LVAKPEAIKEPDNLIKLWVHESERIYGDRLVSIENLATYKSVIADIVKKSFAKYNLSKYFTSTPEPLIFAQFVSGLEERLYD
jgi:dynein heavy chain